MTPSVPFRDTFWNVPLWAQIVLYVGGAIAVAIFAYGVWQRVRLWRAGGPEHRLDRIPDRVKLVAKHALGQARVLSQAYPGIMHATMFWGFLALFMGTVLATIDYDITLPLFGWKLLKGPFYLVYETVLDLFGLFFVIGLGMALYRRFVVRPKRIDPTARFAAVLTLLFVINVTGFVMEACRLAVVQPSWAVWSPVGWALGQAFLALGASEAVLKGVHLVFVRHRLPVDPAGCGHRRMGSAGRGIGVVLRCGITRTKMRHPLVRESLHRLQLRLQGGLNPPDPAAGAVPELGPGWGRP